MISSRSLDCDQMVGVAQDDSSSKDMILAQSGGFQSSKHESYGHGSQPLIFMNHLLHIRLG